MERGSGRGRYETFSWAPDFARTTGRRSAAARYRAFIPAKIAEDDPTLTAGTAALAERAATAVRDLNASPARLTSLEGMARQLLRSEALASSRIEGLQLSHRKLAEASLEGRATDRAKEVLANMKAMEAGIEVGATATPIVAEDVKAIHRELAIVPPLDQIAGRFRDEQGWIGGASPPEAEYVGPPAEHVEPLIDDLSRFMNRDDVPPVVQAAIAHAQFELIHPFGDGNGRVGRVLIHSLFRKRDLAERYVPPVSLVFGANKDAYIAGLVTFQENEIDRWVSQFSRAVELSVHKATEFSAEVGDLQDQWRERVAPIRKDAAALKIINGLPSFPYITVKAAQEIAEVSNPAANNALTQLEDAGILTRHRNRRRGDTWEAKELFPLLDRFEASVKTIG